eukprot:615871-Hanusia_phi.AAC.2
MVSSHDGVQHAALPGLVLVSPHCTALAARRGPLDRPDRARLTNSVPQGERKGWAAAGVAEGLPGLILERAHGALRTGSLPRVRL